MEPPYDWGCYSAGIGFLSLKGKSEGVNGTAITEVVNRADLSLKRENERGLINWTAKWVRLLQQRHDRLVTEEGKLGGWWNSHGWCCYSADTTYLLLKEETGGGGQWNSYDWGYYSTSSLFVTEKNPEEVNETAMIKAVTIQAQKTCHWNIREEGDLCNSLDWICYGAGVGK